MTDHAALFPSNPSHGAVFELYRGLFYQFDQTINAWIKLASTGVILSLATDFANGAMSALDLKKLNRLVLPPPSSTIIGTDCAAPFRHGAIDLVGDDEFVNVTGDVTLQNIDSFGEAISQKFADHIHQHTYGFDFTFDLPAFIRELIRRNQYNVKGRRGERGNKGEKGEHGPDDIFTGPQGDQGEQGTAPPCEWDIENENLNVEPIAGLKKALVDARIQIDVNDPLKFRIEFDRQAVGVDDSTATKLHVRSNSSSWVLAVVDTSPLPQALFYVDVDPLVEAIRQKYLSEIDRIKKGYEEIVKFWIQTMSDLFDEQKSALCCALEFCISATKSIETRRHIESVAATAAISDAKVDLHGRNSNEASFVSSTTLRSQIDAPDHEQGGGPNICVSRPEAAATKQILEREPRVTIDPLLHSSLMSALQLDLPVGRYVAIIHELTAQIDQLHYGTVHIQSNVGRAPKTFQFLDKGSFTTLLDAKNAYQGLSLPFDHDGGSIKLWLPSLGASAYAGSVVIDIKIREGDRLPRFDKLAAVGFSNTPTGDTTTCRMTKSHLAWYKKAWEAKRCCGMVVNLMGQDYIIIKKSLGQDTSCGGGESLETPCISKYMDAHNNHPAFAWPTLDGVHFAPLPTGEIVVFKTDQYLTSLVQQSLADDQVKLKTGNPNNARHLAYQFSTVLFPTQ